MNANKIGFNNFKAFGEKMQTFSKKPITLVYGPNSIGKSSLLHSQLYLEYLRNIGSPINLLKTNFAGDSLDLNGFENFIHKHEINRELKHEYTIHDTSTIAKLISNDYLKIKKLANDGFFKMKIDLELLDDKLKTHDSENISTFKSKISYIKSKKQIDIANTVDENKESQDINMIKENSEKSLKITIKLAYVSYKKSENIDWEYNNDKKDFKKYEVMYLKEVKKLENTENILEKAIILTQSNNPEDIYDQLHFFQYLSNISTMKLLITLSMVGGKGLQSSLDYYIDNDRVFHINQKIFDINYNHALIVYLKKKETKYLRKISELEEGQEKSIIIKDLKDLEDEAMEPSKIFGYAIVAQFFTKFLDIFSDFLYQKTCVSSIHILKTRALSFLNNVNNQKTVQYFSPLRFYPERWNLTEKIKARKNNKQSVDNQSALAADMVKNMNSRLYRKPFIYLNIKFMRTLFTSHSMYDGINHILPDSMKLTPIGTYTSQKFWSKLIHSENLQDKLNHWFSDDSKLKSTYTVNTREHKPQYPFPINIFGNLFGIKPKVEKELYFLDLRTNTEVTPRDMGLGISQMLPILLASLDSENTKIFAEQPELHLHPKVQAELADEFIRSYKENNNEFIIETHSEHLLLRIMKRMRYAAEDRPDRDKTLDLTPDDVCLLYIDTHKGKTFIRELELDKDGSLLSRWPSGFFEESYNEMFS